MKKTLILLAALLGFAVAATAQPRALGVRAGYGGELSYQHSLGNNFAEFDLGWFAKGFDVAAIYDFIVAGTGEVNVYAGPGAQVGFYNYEDGQKVDLGVALCHFDRMMKAAGRQTELLFADPQLALPASTRYIATIAWK